MWTWLSKTHTSSRYCDEVCSQLERTGAAERGERVAPMGSLLSQLPEDMRKHVYSCEACRAFADGLVEVRAMFRVRELKAQPGPYFLTRVMASIHERELEVEQTTQTWAAVPRLASRLTVLASLGLLIAASWVYQMPKSTTSAGLNAAQASEGLVDTGAVQDDLLVSGSGR